MTPRLLCLSLAMLVAGCDPRSVDDRDAGSAGQAVAQLPPTPVDTSPHPELSEVEQELVRTPAENAHSPASPTSRIFGRTLDEHGLAIAGVELHLHSVGEPWSAASDEPGSSFQTTTDENGRFEFVTPVPTASWVSLIVTASAFHAQADRAFGEAGGRNRDPIRAGDNDLGDFVLAAAGSIAGVVTDADGRPVADALVGSLESLAVEVSPGARTDGTGAFVLAHLPEGRVTVEVFAEGFLTGVSSSFHVVEGQQAGPVSIELHPAPVISGRIEDEDGRPIPGAEVKGGPVNGGRKAYAVTGPDGSFFVRLPEAKPYGFQVAAEGFVPIGETGGDPEVVLEPDSMGVVLALRRSPRWTFTVVDDATGEPVERFGLRVRPKPDGTWLSSIDESEIPMELHAGGSVACDADPTKHLVQIQAAGYAPGSSGFESDSASRSHEFRLLPASTLTASVMFRGAAVGQLTARVRIGTFKIDPSLPDEDDPWWSDNYGVDLDRFTGRPRQVQGDSQGRFRFIELAAGTYSLELRAPGAAPWTHPSLKVERSATTDLGTIELRPGGTVRGRVQPAPGRDVAGTTVYLGETFDEVFVVVKADGVFEFADLASGPHSLIVERTPGRRDSRVEVPFTAVEGETVVQDIDLTE